MKCCEITIIPRYADTDQMGIVYHASYFPWFEVGRDDFFRKMGYAYSKLEKSGYIMPVLKASCQYFSIVEYDEVIILKTTLEKFRGARMRFRYELFREGSSTLLSKAIIDYSLTNKTYQPINIKNKNPLFWKLLNEHL